MNKHLYKVIFNQERGQMMVVPENATAQGQSSTNTSAENPVAEPVDSSFVSGCLKPLTFSLMLMFGTAFIAETTEAANIQADKNAPKNEQPIVLQTPNGLPQVNIQTPSKAGVSVNQYRQFDVDEKGAILNNSRTNTQTQQAGWIQGNPLLATGEAKIIVNQVNSQNPSLLNGYVEVGGKRAEVILANPAGIQVNGGGFINAQSATLSTGQTLIRSGQLDQYAVHDGKISIKGKGLNAKDTDFTKIIGRYVEVDAPIAANDLTVIAGQNTVAADGKIQAAAKNTPKQKAVAIDTSELGGMYANKITLISTENNQSIDNKGQVFANAGGVTLDSQGNLSNAGTIASQGKTNIKAKDLDNSGTLSSKEQFDIKADNVDNSGTVLAANELNVRVSGSMKQTQSGNIEAARLDVETTKLDNAGTISQTGLQDLAIESTGALTNSGKIGYPEADNTVPTTANGGTTGTTAPTQNTPSSATGSGNATAVSSPSSIQNFATGSLKTRETLNNSGTINANGGVDLTAKNGLNNTAELQLNKLAVSGNVLDNSQAKISAQSTDIQTQSVNNAQGELLASKTLNISTVQLDNRAGKLQSVDNANLTVSGSLNNQKGEIAANNALNIQDKQAQNLHIDNTDGTIVANHVSLQSKSLNNQGKLAAGNHLSIDLKDDFTVERNLEAGNKLNIKTAGSLNNSQTIQAESEVNIQAKQNISNRGMMNSNGLTRVEAGQELLNIGTGKIYGNHVALAADSVVNRDENGKAAVVAARERLDIGARKIINQTEDETPVNSDGHSKLLSEDTLFIGRHLNENHHATGKADSLDNLSANIESAGDMSISAAQTTNKNLHIHTAIEKVGTEHKNTISFSNRRSGEHG
nr:filamentous hemagglutinin N-terminal domain-containing protein [Alysiella crassa]UOP08311.1 filamentous hemagglutinin N-terminal domain-containing protein [Alysiella crassa]